MTIWRASVIIALTIFATLAVVSGVLARNGLAAVGEPLTAAEDQVLYMARKAVVALAAHDARNPLSNQPNVWQSVAGEYLEHCAICHGRAGRGDATLEAQFFPAPPDLTQRSTQQLSDGELYHVIANGIRFTAMPGWSATHGSDELWRYVAFVRQLPHLNEEAISDAAGQPASDTAHHAG